MQFLKNKHLVLAMFIAPLLAVLAYFMVDKAVSEKPHVAIQGGKYKLLARSNCRYKSGLCTLENGDIKLKLYLEAFDNKPDRLYLRSAIPLQKVLISLVDKNRDDSRENIEPLLMQASSKHFDLWSIPIQQAIFDKHILRLVVSISNTLYYAETTMIFLDYETSFSRDNFVD